jgi:hypothetical protein
MDGLPRTLQAVEKLPVAAGGPRFWFKNACFEPLKPDLKPPESIYAVMNVPGSSFSTRCRILGNPHAGI